MKLIGVLVLSALVLEALAWKSDKRTNFNDLFDKALEKAGIPRNADDDVRKELKLSAKDKCCKKSCEAPGPMNNKFVVCADGGKKQVNNVVTELLNILKLNEVK